MVWTCQNDAKGHKVRWHAITQRVRLQPGWRYILTGGPPWIPKFDREADGWSVLVNHLIEDKMYHGICREHVALLSVEIECENYSATTKSVSLKPVVSSFIFGMTLQTIKKLHEPQLFFNVLSMNLRLNIKICVKLEECSGLHIPPGPLICPCLH